MEYGYLFYIVIGFLSGSILFGRIIPFLLKKVDVMQESDDGNFNKGKGGKGIAVSFGVLLGLLPIWQPLVLLAVCYILFLIAIPAKSDTRKSIYAFLVFGIGSLFVVKYRTIMCGCILIAGIVIHKHYLSAIACEHDREKSYE